MIKAVMKFDDGNLAIHNSNVAKVGVTFDPGFYTAGYDGDGKMWIEEEKLKNIQEPYPSKIFNKIVKYCTKFYDKDLHKKVNDMGFKHKLGILLHGAVGTGKTTFLYYLADKVFSNYEGICMIARDGSQLNAAISLCKSIREIQDNPIIIIADEFERWAKEGESQMKSFLDGVDSIDNLLFLAATNYLDKVPASLKNRPSRFKGVYEVLEIKDQKIIRDLIQKKSDIVELFTSEEMDVFAKELADKGTTLDEIKNFILDKVLDESLDIETSGEIGFKKDADEDDDFNIGILESLETIWATQKASLVERQVTSDSNI